MNVYEASSQIVEVGAGMQIGPNMSRVLRRWGLLDDLLPHAIKLEALSLRRYADDSELARISIENVEIVHGAPTLAAHRADLQNTLRKGAIVAGALIHTNSFVEDIDFENTRLKIKGASEWTGADVIIAADGVKSMIRKKMLALRGEVDRRRETGDAAWRVVISAAQIYESQDATLIEALEGSVGLRWMGPNGHIMCYPIKNHTLLNIVLLHPDKPSTEESWTTRGDKTEMIEFYKNWNPRIKKLLDLVPRGEILEWKLCDHAPLATWVEGGVALLGDAAHPMLPYVAQGAAQAIEDAAVLSTCLAMITKQVDIPTALKVYELVRKERAETVQASAIQTRLSLHLHDGREQQERDEIIRNAAKGGPSPDLWSDKAFQQWCWVSFIHALSERMSQTMSFETQSTDTEQQTVAMWDQLVSLVTSGAVFESPFSTKNLPWLEKMGERFT